MTFMPQHPFQPAKDGDWCTVPVPADDLLCCHPADHPIHQVDKPLYGAIAARLAAYQWGATEVTQHRRHLSASACAICGGDVHALAAAVTEMFLPGHAVLPRTEGRTVEYYPDQKAADPLHPPRLGEPHHIRWDAPPAPPEPQEGPAP